MVVVILLRVPSRQELLDISNSLFTDTESKQSISDNIMTMDASTRFSIREKKKLWFLGE